MNSYFLLFLHIASVKINIIENEQKKQKIKCRVMCATRRFAHSICKRKEIIELQAYKKDAKATIRELKVGRNPMYPSYGLWWNQQKLVKY